MSSDEYQDPVPQDSPAGATIPRYVAAVVDNVIAMILGVVAAKQFPDTEVVLQAVVLVVAYLGFYFISESLFSTTIGKSMNGLVVRRFEGGRCSVVHIGIRTLFRVIEVNPLLLGALPAAASILWTEHKQRFGDMFARTVVVRR